MLKDKLKEAQDQFGIFNNFFSTNEFRHAREAEKGSAFLINYLGERVTEFIPPAELVKVEFDTNPSSVDKLIALAYTGTNKLQCQAYNAAITEVMEAASMPISISTGHRDNIGYKSFEVLNRFDSKAMIRLIPAIHKEAEKVYKLLYKMKSHKV